MIRLEGVTKRFRSAAGERVALDGVDLTVAAGQVFGVVGRSGAGKSTLIRAINLLERPDAGRVIVDGQEITALSPAELRAARRRIGMIFQHFNLLNAKTIAENVAFPLRLEGRPSAEVRSSGSASPGRWRRGRRCCCATRRPARSIPRRPTRF